MPNSPSLYNLDNAFGNNDTGFVGIYVELQRLLGLIFHKNRKFLD
jgi:hypothetical protein